MKMKMKILKNFNKLIGNMLIFLTTNDDKK
jgi:hypothetical protein